LDNIFEIIGAVVLIGASILAEVLKGKGKDDTTPSPDNPDLQSLEDFFKRQAGGGSEPASGPHREERDGEFASLEGVFTSVGSAPSGPPPAQMPREHDRARDSRPAVPRKKRKKESPPPPPPQRLPHVSSEGECLDEAPHLTGMVSLERAPVGALSGSRGAALDRRGLPPVHPSRQRLTRANLRQAFIFQELMQRYDLERIFSRIPGRRRRE